MSHALEMTSREIRTRIICLLGAGEVVFEGKSAFDPKKRYPSVKCEEL